MALSPKGRKPPARLFRSTGLRWLLVSRIILLGQIVDRYGLDRPGEIHLPELLRRVAAIPEVRAALVAFQRSFARREPGAVLDGRDIGTTVFPDAELKIFVTATPEIRAQRRYDELKAKGEEASFDEILENVKQRDYIDQNRDVSPLRKASDALLLDNSHLSISQQKEWLAEQFERVIKEKN